MRTPRRSPTLFSSVLCPVDFSDHSRVALRFAAALARRRRASLHVLFVNDPLLVAAAAAASSTAALGGVTTTELRRFVATALSARTRAQLRPTCTTALGTPVREILRSVKRNGHDVIVVGTKGLNGARRLLLGSTTSELLRRAPVPVLAVPPAGTGNARPPSVGASWPGRKIVVAIELGSRVERDIRSAARVAGWFEASATFVHVVPVPPTPDWFSPDVDALLQVKCRKAAQVLDAALTGAADLRSTATIRIGHPPDEIAAVAAEQKAGLIVMGLRGRTGLFGEPAGSLAYQVLCHRIAPVLTLPDAPRKSAGT